MHRILLINPPIYDFSAYDFWSKPYGLLQVAGYLRGKAELHLFDFLNRLHPSLPKMAQKDPWGRGKFTSVEVERPAVLAQINRKYRRYGLSEETFQGFLETRGPFDFALVQTNMTYWYPGVRDVLATLKKASPGTKTVLGGTYATICPQHAASLGADLVIRGLNLDPLWALLDIVPDFSEPPLWEGYEAVETGVLKLSDGCPFKCTYCSVPKVYPSFQPRSTENEFQALELMIELGIRQVAFYDDALLFHPKAVLQPFLDRVSRSPLRLSFHTPNALHARFLTRELAQLMVDSGFKTFYLGFESNEAHWLKTTGGKVYSHEFAASVENLRRAGAELSQITCYLIAGHPRGHLQDLEESMNFANQLGIRVMLSEFSPIPGTPDGESCARWVDLKEPLFHNKAVFSQILLGDDRLQTLKRYSRYLNSGLALSK
jgi:hypothetical protein